MFYNDSVRPDDIDINITNTNSNQNVSANMNDNMNYNEMGGYQMNAEPQMGDVMSPIIEPGRERVVNRTFVHEVPHA